MSGRGVLAAAVLLLAGPARAGEPIQVQATPVALQESDASVERVGPLQFRGGFVLRSPEPRFGGLSDLVVSPDGAWLAAIGDEGSAFTAGLAYARDGRLTGLGPASLAALKDTAGQPLRGKGNQDAESLARLADGSFAVGFEGWHRLWRYSPSLDVPARALPAPPGLEEAPANEGLETLVGLADGRLLALTEGLMSGGAVQGWLRSDAGWRRLGYRVSGALRPSGGCSLPSGDVVVLERNYTPETGVVVGLRRIPIASIVPGAVLGGETLARLARPLSVDNFEGLACRQSAAGETLLYLLSDDNFSSRQRTLLMMFRLDHS